MKQFLFILFFLLFIKANPLAALIFDVSFNVGVFNPSYNGAENKKNVYIPSIDFFVPVSRFSNSNIDAGIGVSYIDLEFSDSYLKSKTMVGNNNTNDTKESTTQLNSFPVYLQLKYSYEPNKNWTVFGVGKAGVAQGFKRYYTNTFQDIDNENVYVDAHISSNYFLGAAVGLYYNNIGLALEYQHIALKNIVNITGAMGEKITTESSAKFVGVKLFYLLSYAY